MTVEMMISDCVSGATGTNDTPHKDDDDSTEDETHAPESLISVLIHVTVIGHSINRQANLLLQILFLLLNVLLNKT